MTLLEQCSEQVIEDTAAKMAEVLGMKLCYFGGDDTWGLHSKRSGLPAALNGITYFPDLPELMRELLESKQLVMLESEGDVIENMFCGCRSLEEILMRLELCAELH